MLCLLVTDTVDENDPQQPRLTADAENRSDVDFNAVAPVAGRSRWGTVMSRMSLSDEAQLLGKSARSCGL
jgi:hypothetical protein